MSAVVKVLIVLSAASELELSDGSIRKGSGMWADEIARPHRALVEAGVQVDVATPGGKRAVLDPASLQAGSENEKYLAGLPAWKKPLVLEEIDDARADGYAAIVLPGGYAPMIDLPQSAALGRILARAEKNGAIVAAICHGPAALLAMKPSPNGRGQGEGAPRWPYAGRRVAAFTNAEERAYLKGLTPKDPIEDRLRAAGVKWSSGANWKSVVVRDGNLITAQNSASCADFTAELLRALDP